MIPEEAKTLTESEAQIYKEKLYTKRLSILKVLYKEELVRIGTILF